MEKLEGLRDVLNTAAECIFQGKSNYASPLPCPVSTAIHYLPIHTRHPLQALQHCIILVSCNRIKEGMDVALKYCQPFYFFFFFKFNELYSEVTFLLELFEFYENTKFPVRQL